MERAFKRNPMQTVACRRPFNDLVRSDGRLPVEAAYLCAGSRIHNQPGCVTITNPVILHL
jgi:hypothetical protein